jgi:hypothetical protein
VQEYVSGHHVERLADGRLFAQEQRECVNGDGATDRLAMLVGFDLLERRKSRERPTSTNIAVAPGGLETYPYALWRNKPNRWRAITRLALDFYLTVNCERPR